MLVVPQAVVLGDAQLATAFVAALEVPWRPALRTCRRRWLGWWAELDGKLRRLSASSRSEQVAVHLRRLTILREMRMFYPPVGAAEPANADRLREYFAGRDRDLHRQAVEALREVPRIDR